MEKINFVHPVVFKKYTKRNDGGVNRPHTTIKITTSTGFMKVLLDYTFDRQVSNADNSDILFIVYKHRKFPNEYAILKF